ncbi:MAG TPA: ATP-dependent helicase [Steroidobacteraceae bacterium]|nr:ATP-dependent helicase [Steroidobacteraceae bacterium]
MAADPLEVLNDAQRAAAAYGESHSGRFAAGPLLVIAGAGTGKTNTLAHRVAHLVLEGVDPARILLLTFTRRAAEEMTRRAERIVASALATVRGARHGTAAVRLPWAGTFHSVGNRLLRLYARSVGLEPSFTVLDRGDSADLIDVVRHELGLSARDKRFPRKDTCLAIYSHRVNTQRPLKATLEEHWPWCADFEAELTGLYRAYVVRKQAEQALDYDDLLLYWHGLVGEPRLAHEVGGLFDHVLVDEYQDTNALQAQILLALKPDGAGLTVVGDDAQSIYSFRAATVDNILSFPAQFAPPARMIALEENYRSTQPILDAANALIAEAARQHAKRLQARRGGGVRPALVTVADDRGQADYVIAEVLKTREAGVRLSQQAVLFRSSHHSDFLEVELTRRNIPFVKYGGLKFLEAAHVKDLLAVLRWADNPRNRIAAFRVLQLLPGMGPAHSQRCLEEFRRSGGQWSALGRWQAPAAAREDWPRLAALMAALASPASGWPGEVEQVRDWYRPHLERRYDATGVRAGDIEQLTRIAGGYPNRERFLSELALDPPQASGDLAGPPLLDEDYLVLSTVHSAKGREWQAVYVLNVNDGNFPSEFAAGKPELLEEERRLLYVAVTRARDALHLVTPLKYYVTQQSRYGDAHVYGAQSRFLTPRVLGTLEPVTAVGNPQAPAPDAVECVPPVDLGARMRSLWS